MATKGSSLITLLVVPYPFYRESLLLIIIDFIILNTRSLFNYHSILDIRSPSKYSKLILIQ